jgi:hypothetical protein
MRCQTYKLIFSIIWDGIDQHYGDYEDNNDSQICLLLTRGDIVINNDTNFLNVFHIAFNGKYNQSNYKKKKPCQRNPFGAKMWNSHMPYKWRDMSFKLKAISEKSERIVRWALLVI